MNRLTYRLIRHHASRHFPDYPEGHIVDNQDIQVRISLGFRFVFHVGQNPIHQPRRNGFGVIHLADGIVLCQLTAPASAQGKTVQQRGSADQTVSPGNSRMLAERLCGEGISHEFQIYDGVEHGVVLGKRLACEPWFDAAVRFLEEQSAHLQFEKNSCIDRSTNPSISPDQIETNKAKIFGFYNESKIFAL